MMKTETTMYQVLLNFAHFLCRNDFAGRFHQPGVIKVVLKSDAKALDEVVVTAWVSRVKRKHWVTPFRT